MDSAPDKAHRFTSLYDTHLQAILGYALRRLVHPADAADVVAETFMVAWRRIDIVPDGGERLWLYGVARRVLANHRRGDLRRSQLADRLRVELATRPPLSVDQDAFAVDAAVMALATMTEAEREVMQLTAWEGLTPAEVATVLSLPATTVRARLHRARTRLRAILDEDDQRPSVTPRRNHERP